MLLEIFELKTKNNMTITKNVQDQFKNISLFSKNVFVFFLTVEFHLLPTQNRLEIQFSLIFNFLKHYPNVSRALH